MVEFFTEVLEDKISASIKPNYEGGYKMKHTSSSTTHVLFRMSLAIVILGCFVFSMATNAVANSVTLQDDSYVKSRARTFWWGHTTNHTVTPLPLPGQAISAALQEQGNYPDYVNNVTTTLTSTGGTGFAPTVFTVVADPQDMDTDGYLESLLCLHFTVDAQFDYDISGYYNTSGSHSSVTEKTWFYVWLKNLDTGEYLFTNEQYQEGDPINLTVGDGSPLGDLFGTLPAGNYEFYVKMTVGTSSESGWAFLDRDGVGAVTLELTSPCEGDFDNDGDVDGSDLAVFAADFGRTDCPCIEESYETGTIYFLKKEIQRLKGEIAELKGQ